jgi:hypothetical protein
MFPDSSHDWHFSIARNNRKVWSLAGQNRERVTLRRHRSYCRNSARIFLPAPRFRAVDSRLQAALYGDASAALRQGLIRLEDLVELGQIVANPCAYQRKSEDITLVDLTGVAVQDIAFANLALAALNKDISDASKSRG